MTNRWRQVTIRVVILVSVLLLIGVSGATAQAQPTATTDSVTTTVTETVTISVTDSANGQDTANTTVTIQQDTGNAPELVAGTPAVDLNEDGLYDDLNGNGETDRGDAQALFNRLNDEAVTSRVSQFDRNGNNAVDRGDVQALFNQRDN
jgi:hypothetical protein